jgi:hypothetical protein
VKAGREVRLPPLQRAAIEQEDDMTGTTAADHLTTGWEPDLPVGDTILRQFVANWAASAEGPVIALGGRAFRTEHVAVADLGRPAGFWNGATLLQPLSGELPDEVLRMIDGSLAHGTGDVHLWSVWPTPDLSQRGWRLGGHPPLLLLPPGAEMARERSGIRIEQVRDAETLRAYEYVAVHGYPFPELQPLTPGAYVDARLLREDRLRMWVAYDSDEPVAVGALFTEAGLAQLALGVSLPSVRGRGFWSALVRRRITAAAGLPVVAVCSDMSRRGLEAMAFLPLLRLTLWLHPRL